MTRFPEPELEFARNTGFFRPGDGTNSGRGRGSPDPTCDGADSLSHGSGNSVDAPRSGVLVGSGNSIAAENSDTFGWGEDNAASAPSPVNGRIGLFYGCANLHQGDFGSLTGGENNLNVGLTNVVVGNTNTVGGLVSGESSAASAVIGFFNETHSGFSLTIGGFNFIQKTDEGGGGEMLVVGFGNTGILSDQSLLLGHFNRSEAQRTIAHGEQTHAIRAEQRAFSADRKVLGAAQFSFMPIQTFTLDDTPKVIRNVPLQPDKGFMFRIDGAAYNTDTDDVMSGFEGVLAAYRKSNGDVVVIGTPTLSNTGLNTGAPAASYAVAIAPTPAGATIGPDGGTGFEFTASTVIRNDGGDWLTDGLKVGDFVDIALAEDAGNNGRETVTDVTATVLTFDAPAFTPNAADTLVTFDRVVDSVDISVTGDATDEVKWCLTPLFTEVLG